MRPADDPKRGSQPSDPDPTREVIHLDARRFSYPRFHHHHNRCQCVCLNHLTPLCFFPYVTPRVTSLFLTSLRVIPEVAVVSRKAKSAKSSPRRRRRPRVWSKERKKPFFLSLALCWLGRERGRERARANASARF